MIEKYFNLGDKVISWKVGKEFIYYVGIVAGNKIKEQGYEDAIIIDIKENAVTPEVSVSPYTVLADGNLKLVQKSNTVLFSKKVLCYIKKVAFLCNGSIKWKIAVKLLNGLQNSSFYFVKINVYVIRFCIYKFFSKIKNILLSLLDLFFSDFKFFLNIRAELTSADDRLKILPALSAFEKASRYSTEKETEAEKEIKSLKERKFDLQKTKNESSRGFVTFIVSILSLLLVFFQYKLTKNQTFLMTQQTALMNQQTEIQNNQLKLENEKTLPHFTVFHQYIRNENNEIIGDGLYIKKDENYAQDIGYDTFALVSTKPLVPDSEPCVYFGVFNYYSNLQYTDDFAFYSSHENLELIKNANNKIIGKIYKNKRLESLRVENYVKIDCSDMYGIQHTYYFKSDTLSSQHISENTYKRAEEIFSKNNIGGIDNLEDFVLKWVKRNCKEKKE